MSVPIRVPIRDLGDGDPCPQDPEHDRLYVTKSRKQWCPSAEHRGRTLYEWDGVTLAGRPAKR